MPLAPSIPPGGVRGGKEEIRAALLKPYLLRLRKERGERHASSVLLTAGIDPDQLDNETAWLSASRARRALRVFAQELGERALEHRGRWAVHAEALGTHMRLLRSAKSPIDAYRFLAANASEQTRIGTWEVDAGPGEQNHAKLSYKLREDEGGTEARHGERWLCAARRGELASYPVFWGFPEANIVHSACIADDAPACVYEVRWKAPHDFAAIAASALGGATLCGGSVGIAGGLAVGGLAVVLGATLGGGAGLLWQRNRRLAHARVFELHRISSLERALQLRGDGAEARAPAPGELTGTVLGGKYRIGRKIGSGGIGVVYAAEHTSLGHEVAIKVLRGAAAMDGSEIARLRREAHIQVRLDQHNIARVMDLDQMADGSIYVVMERLHGRSLADKMSKEGPVAPGFAVPCFVDVCRALAAAHDIGVVHRDLKPGNIFLCEDGNSKVLDFGMSKLTSAESLTQAGYTLGTPEYMAPEQCIGANVEPRTDLYAFGVVMYEALTGELPINSANRRELLDLHQRQVPKPMRVRRPDLPIPAELDIAVMTCLRKKVGERPRDANELEQMLLAIDLTELPTSYAQLSSRPRAAVR